LKFFVGTALAKGLAYLNQQNIMKTLFTFALAGALTFSSLAAFGADDLKANSDAKAYYKKVNVLVKEGVGTAKIALYDKNGRKLHQQKVKTANHHVILPYDLSQMPIGEYVIQIQTDQEQVKYTVETFEKPSKPVETPLMAYGKKVDDETIKLTVIGLEEPGVEVQLRYIDNNRVIITDEISELDGFSKNYKLVGVSADNVYFQVKDVKGRSKLIYME
jgi:hypothetical protein